MEILVSINCITYNHENYIAEALEGFLMQKTKFSYEILIHDDASTDRTQEVIKTYYKKFPDLIKPILQKENQQSKGIRKISYRFNHTRAKGKYIAICEGDDYWIDPYKLQKQIDYLESHPECTMCFHASQVVNSNKKVKILMRPYKSNKICPTEDIITGGGGFCPTQSIVYRKSIFDNPPDFYFKAPVGDYPLQMITACKGYAYYIDEVMSVYRKVVSRGTSWSSQNKSVKSNIEMHANIINMLQDFDLYTNFKYRDAISKAIRINNFYKIINQQNFKEFMNKTNLSYFKGLSLRQKILIILRLVSPAGYLRMIDLKYK